MNNDEKYKVHKLAYASKKGIQLTPEEMAFLEKMYKQYPEEYTKVTDKAHQEAVDEIIKGFQNDY